MLTQETIAIHSLIIQILKKLSHMHNSTSFRPEGGNSRCFVSVLNLAAISTRADGGDPGDEQAEVDNQG